MEKYTPENPWLRNIKGKNPDQDLVSIDKRGIVYLGSPLGPDQVVSLMEAEKTLVTSPLIRLLFSELAKLNEKNERLSREIDNLKRGRGYS